MQQLAKIERIFWFCLLLLVPIAASPLLPFGSGTLARPLAIAPAALLLLLAGFRILVLRQRPQLQGRGLKLLAIFAVYIAISGLIVAAMQPPDMFKGQEPIDSLLRALLTLAVGLVFYLVACLQIRTAADVRSTIRYLFIGMTASVALAAAQTVALATQGDLLRAVQSLTDLFAVHYQNLDTRAQGMTFEPSWLATQIIVLLVPALIAGSISRQDSVDMPGGKGHTLRLIGGFVVAIAGLLFSGSRFGLGAIVGMLIVGGLIAARRGRLYAAMTLFFVLFAGGGGLYAMSSVGTGAGSTYVLGPVAYLTGTADLDTSNPDLTTNVTDALALASRAAGMQAAASMWLDHPLFGVSFGNNFRYFGKYAPDWVLATGVFTQGNREVAGWLDPSAPEKGTARNMALRLLSETGIMGFLLFSWFFLRQIFRGPARDSYHAYFRLACAMALGFGFLNLDTFVDPNLWIPLALCVAMNNLPPQAQPATQQECSTAA